MSDSPADELPPPGVPARQYSKSERHAVNRLLLDRHATGAMCRELKAERARQDVRWGEQNHPDMTGQPSLEWFTAQAERSRDRAEHHARTGTLAWDHILQEEWDEAREQAAHGNTHNLRTELIQVMAVAAAWVEAIDRRETLPRPWTTPRNDGKPHAPGCRWTYPEHPAGCLDDPTKDYSGPRQMLDGRFLTERESFDATTMHDVANGQPRTITGLGMTEQTRNALADMGYVVQEWQEPHLDAIVVSKPERGKAQAYLENRAASGRVDASAVEPDEAHRLRANGFDVGPVDVTIQPMKVDQIVEHLRRSVPSKGMDDVGPVGAAGQPVSSYSGGGVRDVTEGKPSMALLWPRHVPYESQLWVRVGHWLALGAKKYAYRNWELFCDQEALNHAYESLSRHYAALMSGATDEDHLAAVVTNALFVCTIEYKISIGWTPEVPE